MKQILFAPTLFVVLYSMPTNPDWIVEANAWVSMVGPYAVLVLTLLIVLFSLLKIRTIALWLAMANVAMVLLVAISWADKLGIPNFTRTKGWEIKIS